MKFNQVLRAKRKELGLTQQDIADIWGIKAVNVSDWERGKFMPETARLAPLAKRLGISISELMGESARHGCAQPAPDTESVLADDDDGADQSRKAYLQWVADDEAALLNQYRRMALPERELLRISAEQMPKISSTGIAGKSK